MAFARRIVSFTIESTNFIVESVSHTRFGVDLLNGLKNRIGKSYFSPGFNVLIAARYSALPEKLHYHCYRCMLIRLIFLLLYLQLHIQRTSYISTCCHALFV